MPNFTSKVDFSTQIKSYENTEGTLSGSVNVRQYSILGVDYSELELGLDVTTTAVTSNYTSVSGYFTGTTGTTTFYFSDTNMDIAIPYLSAITSSNSATTQNVGTLESINTVIEDGNSFDVYFSGVSYDLNVTQMVEYTPNEFSGTTFSYVLNYLSGSTYPWWFLKSGSTTWNEIKGRTKTDRITITESATTGYVLTCLDPDGNAIWQPSSSGSSFTGGSSNCITDFYVTNIHGCSPINIQPTSSDNIYIGMGGGNVGIGTSSPTQKLHISGNTRIEKNINNDVSLVVNNSNNGGNLARSRFETVAIADASGRILSGIFATSGYNTAIPSFGDNGTNYLKNALTITVGGDAPRGDINIGARYPGTFLRFFASDNTVPVGDFNELSLRGSLNSDGYWGFGQNMTGQTSTVDIKGSTGYNQFRMRTSYKPTTSGDTNGAVGNVAWDDNYLYMKTNTGWGRINIDYNF